jgi:hypothetical protein
MSQGADYRELALKRLPWICARCAREFPASRLKELTVHHKDGNHHHNPPDGSNWELLCIYCHENEHARVEDARAGGGGREPAKPPATHKPFEKLAGIVKPKKSRGYATYIMIPLTTGLVFGAAAFAPLVKLYGASPLPAIACAAAGVVLYFLMHLGDELEQFICLVVAVLTLIGTGFVVELADETGLAPDTLRLSLVVAAMAALAAANLLMLWRKKRK